MKLKIMWITAIKYAALFDAFLVFFLAITIHLISSGMFFFLCSSNGNLYNNLITF